MKLGLTGALAAWVSVLCSAGVGQVVTAEALRAAHLSRAEQISIHQTPTPDEGVTLEFTALGRNFMVDLRPSTVRAPGAVLVEAAGDQQREVPWPPAATFIGEIRDLAGSIVAGAVVNGRWRLVIDQGPQRPGALFVQPWSEILGGPQEGYAAYAETDLLPGDWTCGAGAAQLLPAQSPRGYGSRAACNTLAQVAFDADFEFYQANGSSTATAIADIESVVNTMNVIYARDTNIIHQISYTLIRTAEPDPYTTTNAGGVLDEFAAEWQNNQSGVTRDIAHLMTGKEIDGNVIGVAYVGAVCTYGYGYSQSRFTTNLAYRTGLTAHEIGHNWGAGHCDGDSDCYIMCSGIGGCSGNVTRFGSRSIRDIRAFVPTRTCLEAADGFPTPVPPRPQADQAATTVNTPVRIDVLANDFDGNCETVTILSFPARANCGHGSLARSVGTGPGGRDEIRYTPDAGFSGADCFTYSARDPSGRSDSASVAITVLPLRTPDNPPFPEPGLSAAYYHTLPAELADLSLTTPYLSGTVATVNFPASSDPFATSGRAVGVGAIFTGTLNIATGGAYTLFTESDDGSALYVNNLLLVANDGPQGMTERSGAVSLPAGPAQIRIEYFQGAGAGGLIARIQGPSLPKQVIPASMWAAPGVHVDYYNLGNEINDLPDLAALTPASRDIVSTLNQPTVDPYFFGSARRTNLAASFIGYFNAPTAGLYRFFTTSDDASALWIGNTLVVDNRGAHGMVERSGYAALAAGRHAIRVEYWQGGGGAGLIVEAEGPSMARAPIPDTDFCNSTESSTD